MNVSGATSCVVAVVVILIALCSPCASVLPGSKPYQTIYGKGSDPNDRPFAKCLASSLKTLRCTVGVDGGGDDKSESCDFTITADTGMSDVEVGLIHQFPGKKLLLVWQETSSNLPDRFSRNMYAVNVKECDITKKLVFPRNPFDWRNLVKLIFYDNGFETISEDSPLGHSERSRRTVSASFDADGKMIKIFTVPPGTTEPQQQADKEIKDIVDFASQDDES